MAQFNFNPTTNKDGNMSIKIKFYNIVFGAESSNDHFRDFTPLINKDEEDDDDIFDDDEDDEDDDDDEDDKEINDMKSCINEQKRRMKKADKDLHDTKNKVMKSIKEHHQMLNDFLDKAKKTMEENNSSQDNDAIIKDINNTLDSIMPDEKDASPSLNIRGIIRGVASDLGPMIECKMNKFLYKMDKLIEKFDEFEEKLKNLEEKAK